MPLQKWILKTTVKIVVIGPESTGKSTLTKQLAAYFNAPFVAEFAREYLEARPTRNYELADLELIAREQVARTNIALAAKPKLLFCDTDLVTLHIWALDKFDQEIFFVAENLLPQKADLYLLCAPDLPWQPDPLREDAKRRDTLFEWNVLSLKAIDAQVVIITGEGEMRLENAIQKINYFLKNDHIQL